MRIVYYVAGWPPDRFPNGIVTASACLVRELARAGVDARILAARGAPRADEDNIHFIEETAKRGGIADYARRLRRRLSRHGGLFDAPAREIAAAINRSPALAGADIVEIEESFGWSRIVARRVSAAVVTRLHGPYFLTGGALAGGDFTPLEEERIRREGAAIAAADFVTAPSRFVLEAVRERYRCALADARVIPNPVPIAENATQWRREAANPDEILFVGRFDRIKGADILLAAFAELAARYPELRLTFAGPAAGTIRIGARDYDRSALLKEIMPPEAAARVDFLGAVSRETLAGLRARAFLTIVASRFENFPNVLLEAMAQGAPTVATAVGGAPEIARNGADALLVPAEPAALARAVGRLLDNPGLAARLGEQGHKRVMREFSADRVAALTLAAYEDFLARRRADRDGRGTGAR